MPTLSIGGTQASGTSKVLTPLGFDNQNRYRYALPDHTALAGRTIAVKTRIQAPTPSNPGFSEASVDVAFTDAPTDGNGGASSVYVNLKVRWTLNQDGTLVDTALDTLQGIAYAAFLEDAVKKGIITLV